MSQPITLAIRSLRLGTLLVLSSAVLASCTGGGGQSFFMLNKNTQAIRRDTVVPDGVHTFIQNPKDSVNGIIKLAPVDPVPLVQSVLNANGNTKPPFDKKHMMMLPPGFTMSVYAAELNRPRDMALRDDGTLFYDDFDGKVIAISPDGKQTTIAEGLSSPHGLEIVNGVLFYTDEQHLYRFEFSSPTAVTGRMQILSDKLPPGAQHYTRAIRWVPAEKKFYIAVGSSQNKGIEDDNQHGTMLRISDQGGTPDAATRGGLRDVVAMDVNPNTGELWALDNGTELLSPVLPPTEVNIIKIGKHYGWPFFYSQNFRDPDYQDATPTKYPRFPMGPTPPVIELEAHAEVLGMRFYTGSAFGNDWHNAMVIAYHSIPKIVRVQANGDGTNARQADVVTGFDDPVNGVWGRPVSVAISKDGRTLYISDDKAGAIYKVTKQ
ncbi:MAG TPA: PQQ-dependent sugar dehydrogenase [Candidatus Kapabacteria bacterium]|nr:PQQ-dependent sugar dehydrogenase [Candidatus Kapabacteria bacterium]